VNKKKGLRGGWLMVEWTTKVEWGTFVVFEKPDGSLVTAFEPAEPDKQPPVGHYIPGTRDEFR
jgi:hypothetical protein